MRTEWKTNTPPDKFEKYIVTYSDGSVDTCIWSRCIDEYGGYTNKYHWSFPKKEVIAYMEFPKPYKETIS